MDLMHTLLIWCWSGLDLVNAALVHPATEGKDAI